MSGIPRPGGIPRRQPVGSRLPQLRPMAVAKTPVQAPRRVIAPPKIAPKVRSAPMISVAPKSRITAGGPTTTVVRKIPAPRQTFLPARPTPTSFGFTRRAPIVAPVVTVPASPVAIPTSPVRVGNSIVMVPNEVVVTPQRSPVQILEQVAEPVVVEQVAEPVVVEQVAEPVVVEPVVYPRTPVIFPRRRFRYTDPENELFNQPPTPIYNESVLLTSPNRDRSVILDVSVNPRPVVETQSGEHIVCDVAVNVRDAPMSLVPNRVPRPVGFLRKRRRRARKAPDAVVGEDVIPLTPSSVRDYEATPLSALARRRFSRRILEEGPTGAGFYKILNTSKIRFPVNNELDTSIEWEPENVCEDLNWIHLLSPFKETNLITFSPVAVPINAYDDIDLIQFS